VIEDFAFQFGDTRSTSLGETEPESAGVDAGFNHPSTGRATMMDILKRPMKAPRFTAADRMDLRAEDLPCQRRSILFGGNGAAHPTHLTTSKLRTAR
jgi:hypothetical protein